jgi:hypothetical protein
LFGYAANKVGDAAYGTKFTQDYLNTLWKVNAPFDEALTHGVRVCIQTVPLPKETVPAKDGKPAVITTDDPLSLTVFRNQQSVFLPGLSDSAERHFWRIWKHGAKSAKEYIKDGDEIYFSWSITDQTSGFRDFSQDVFGRRRIHFANEVKEKTLFLKLPWPRFEAIGEPANGRKVEHSSMMLSPQLPTTNGVPQRTKIDTAEGPHDIAVQDVRFRVDYVGNEGRGEVGDKLLQDLDQGMTDVAKMDSRSVSFSWMGMHFYYTFMFLGQ